ncbi:dynactin subunit 4 [Prorops nasuta]|uniref:dynactin subunit 4 n=1 Tax=Prorops nasuta TaxID=863751 RepID=UPI0034CF01C5
MAYLCQPDYVRYACNCGSLKPISKIYFCRHCFMIRCGYCVCQEVDSHYCPNCLEILPTSEARLKKNKCSTCFYCPCCFQTLTTKAGHAPIRSMLGDSEENKDVKATPKKIYYLFCSFCRWSSKDAGIPDQPVATGSWPEYENPYTSRINALVDHHKILASREKQQTEKKKYPTKRPFYQHETYGLFTAALRKRIGRINIPNPNLSSDEPPPAVASDSIEELPPEIFTEEVDLTKITTLEQRLQHPDVQAEKINDLRPQHRQFLIKKSLRCRTCEHNVIKPNAGGGSIKFKIQLAAFYHVPEVKIVTCEPLMLGKTSELLLKFCNPTQHQTEITLFSLDEPLTPIESITAEKNLENPQMGCESPNLLPSAIRQATILEEPRKLNIFVGADLSLPTSSIILPPRDDTAEYDEFSDATNYNFQDDRKLVVWRKENKAVIKLHVTPYDIEETKHGEPIIVGFGMQYGYVNTFATLEHKTPQKLNLKVKLYLTLGDLIGKS